MQVNVGEAKTRLSRLIRLAVRGEDVIIARAGIPVARLVAVPAKGARVWKKPKNRVRK